MMRTRTFTEMSSFETFGDRFQYLRLDGAVGRSTFGFDRYLNQTFYQSAEWKHVRNVVIVRDGGCDLGVPGYEIHERILIHHMNPATVDMIMHRDEDLLNPEYLITLTHRTHNAIHYSDENQLAATFVERRPGDTKLW